MNRSLPVAAPLRRPHLSRMQQMPLLDAGAALVDHPVARIDYWPRACDAAAADAWFDALREGVPWRADRRMMYERDVAVPRLLAHYALAEGDVPAPIHAARAAIARFVDAPFTSVGLNLYRDGDDSVAMHHDRLAELVPGQPIALLSLGAPRRMTIATQAPPRATRTIELQPGSLLVMNYASQLHYLHGIPKTKAPVGPRISLAFRVRPA
jgi:alkylated DNA repair dioxygenase AlkB